MMVKKMPNTIFNTEDSRFISQSFENTRTNHISITEDKLKVILYEHKKYLYDKTSFIAPLSLVISIILTFSTANFNPITLGLKAEVWQAIFVISLILSSLWLIYTLIMLYKSRNADIASLIEIIKDNNRTN